MKKFLFVILLFLTSVVFSQHCIIVDNDTVSLDMKNFITWSDTIYADGVLEVNYGYLNEECGWDHMFTVYYTDEVSDTLEVNDSLIYITYLRGNEFWDTVFRETWKKDLGVWQKTFDHMNGGSPEVLWMHNDTMRHVSYFDIYDGLTEFWSSNSIQTPPIYRNEYEFNTGGDIIVETRRVDNSLLNLWKYSGDQYMTEKLDHYPGQDQYRWVVEDLGDVIRISYEEFDNFFWRWDIVNEKAYPICWFYVDIKENIQDANDNIPPIYFNLLGQEIEKPTKGFYVEVRGKSVKKFFVR